MTFLELLYELHNADVRLRRCGAGFGAQPKKNVTEAISAGLAEHTAAIVTMLAQEQDALVRKSMDFYHVEGLICLQRVKWDDVLVEAITTRVRDLKAAKGQTCGLWLPIVKHWCIAPSAWAAVRKAIEAIGWQVQEAEPPEYLAGAIPAYCNLAQATLNKSTAYESQATFLGGGMDGAVISQANAKWCSHRDDAGNPISVQPAARGYAHLVGPTGRHFYVHATRYQTWPATASR